MKGILFAAALSLVASDALAASRYDITNMSCADVQAVIQKEGEAILRYSSSRILGLPIYDRYVRDRQLCSVNEVLARTGVPTADKPYCPVYRCVESSIFVSR